MIPPPHGPVPPAFAAARGPDHADSGPPCRDGRRLRVLAVDDCPDTVTSVSLLCRMWGYDAMAETDGEAAIETAARFQPDVILLDLAMPHLDGCQVVRRLRQADACKDALIVAVSGFSDRRSVEQATAAGFDFFLVKPLNPALLKAVLDQTRTDDGS